MKQLLYGLVLPYFRFLAKLQLKKFGPDIIGITGSAGKTTCLAAVEAVLVDKYTLNVGYKANSEIGIPLHILGIKPWQVPNLYLDMALAVAMAPIKLLTNWKSFEKYILEMGVDGPLPPKNMGYLLTIVSPRIGIFLNAEAVHAETFDALTTETDPKKRREVIRSLIAQEKGRLLTSLPEHGLAIANADDEHVLRIAQQSVAPLVTFGQSHDTDVRIVSATFTPKGSRIVFAAQETTETLELPNMLVGMAQAYSLAAAVCLALDEDYTLREACDLLTKNFRLPPGRMSVIEGIHDSTIIDSSYNASLVPMLDALSLLQEFPGKRKIALLGDMRELGHETAADHLAVAQKAAAVCDDILLVGPRMQEHALGYFQEQGISARWFIDAYRAADYLKDHLSAGDVLLVKGSQNTLLLEIAVEKLMKHPKKAGQLLARREPFWDKKRAEIGV